MPTKAEVQVAINGLVQGAISLRGMYHNLGNSITMGQSEFTQFQWQWDEYKASSPPALLNVQKTVESYKIKFGSTGFTNTAKILANPPKVSLPSIKTYSQAQADTKYKDMLKAEGGVIPVAIDPGAHVDSMVKELQFVTNATASDVEAIVAEASKLTDPGFKSIPDWALGKGTEIIKNVIYNFNTAKNVFSRVNGVIKLTGVKIEKIAKRLTSSGTTVLNISKKMMDEVALYVKQNVTALSVYAKFVGGELETYVRNLQKNLGIYFSSLKTALETDIKSITGLLQSFITDLSNAMVKDMTAINDWFMKTFTEIQMNIQSNMSRNVYKLRVATMTDFHRQSRNFATYVKGAGETLCKYVKGLQLNVAKEYEALLNKLGIDVNKIEAELTKSINNIKSEFDERYGALIKDATAMTNEIMKQAEFIKAQGKDITKMVEEIKTIWTDIVDIRKRVNVLESVPEPKDEGFKFPWFSGDSVFEGDIDGYGGVI